MHDTISKLAAAIPPQLSAVGDDAHRLAGLITPDAIGAKHSYRITEARTALAVASAHLSNSVTAFNRVAELLTN
jgi:hypothetical protein